MSGIADPDDLPRARSLVSRWPGLVWAIPIAALLLVAYLGLHAFLNRGIDIVVSFETVSGVKAGDTKLFYQGYEAGHVTKVAVQEPSRRLDVTISIDRRAEPILRTGTVFWLIGAKPVLSDVASVKGAITGVTIGVAPSYDGAPTRRFKGLTAEPAVLPGTPGTPYILNAERLGAIQPRSTIDYRGQEIGKVVATRLIGPGHFQARIFILKPYDRLVRPGAYFWPASPVELSFGGGGVQGKAVNPSALLSGGINLGLPPDAAPGQSPAFSRFTLYESVAAAAAGPVGPKIPYALTVSGAGGALSAGAPVTLLGHEVGTVVSRSLVLSGPDGLPATRVTIALEPQRLSGEVDGHGDWRALSDGIARRLIAQGYRARLVQQPPLIGRAGIALVRDRGGRPAALLPGDPPVFPALDGPGDPGEQVADILAKVDRIPFDRIGNDVAALTGRLRAIVSSPRLDQSLDHLHDALANVDQITAEAKPQIGPLMAKLREAASEAAAAAGAARATLAGDGANPDASLPHAIEQLGDAAGSLNSLADYLGRHPEALLKGKGGGHSKVRKAKK